MQDQTTVINQRIVVGITGASGSICAERLCDVLRKKVARIYLVVTDNGVQVARHELRKRSDGDERFSLLRAIDGELDPADRHVIRLCKNNDLFSPLASGSSAPTAMVVMPCSMGTLARIAHGFSSNLLERSADVVLKQKQRLVIAPRETPLSAIHLRNMLSLAELGVHMVPMMPGFYQRPETVADMVDFMVGRVLEVLEIEHSLYTPWNARMR